MTVRVLVGETLILKSCKKIERLLFARIRTGPFAQFQAISERRLETMPEINLIKYKVGLRKLSEMTELSDSEKREIKKRHIATVLPEDVLASLAGTDAVLEVVQDPELDSCELESVQDAATAFKQRFIDDSGNPGTFEYSPTFAAKDDVPPAGTGEFGPIATVSERWVTVQDSQSPAPADPVPAEELPPAELPAETPPADVPADSPVAEAPATDETASGTPSEPAADAPAPEAPVTDSPASDEPASG